MVKLRSSTSCDAGRGVRRQVGAAGYEYEQWCNWQVGNADCFVSCGDRHVHASGGDLCITSPG